MVVLEVLVREKRTGVPVSDLARADFEVLDEGKRRTVSHFSIGEKRQPLAVVLLFDLWPNGAGRFFRDLDVPKSLDASLSKLSLKDEVAVIAVTGKFFNTRQQEVTGFSNDRKRIFEALIKLPNLVDPDSKGVLFVADLLSDVASMARLQRPHSQVVIVYVSDSLNSATPNERQIGTQNLLRQNVTFGALLTKTKVGHCPVSAIYAARHGIWHKLECR